MHRNAYIRKSVKPVNTLVFISLALLLANASAAPLGTYQGQSAWELLLDLGPITDSQLSNHVDDVAGVAAVAWTFDENGNASDSALSRDYFYADSDGDEVADSWLLQPGFYRVLRSTGSTFGGYEFEDEPLVWSARDDAGMLQEQGAGLYRVDRIRITNLIADTTLPLLVTSTPAEDLLIVNETVNDFLDSGKRWASNALGIFARVDATTPTAAADLSGKTFHGVSFARDYISVFDLHPKYGDLLGVGNFSLEFTSTSDCQFSAPQFSLAVHITFPDADGDPSSYEGDGDYVNREAHQFTESISLACVYTVDSNGRVEVSVASGEVSDAFEGQLLEFYADALQRYLVLTDAGHTLDSSGNPVGDSEGTEDVVKGFGLFLREGSFHPGQNVRNNGSAGTYLVNFAAGSFESGIFTGSSPAEDIYGRAVLQFTAQASTLAGHNQCLYREQILQLEKNDSGSEASGNVVSGISAYTSPRQQWDCHFQVGQTGTLQVVLNRQQNGTSLEQILTGNISVNREALALARIEQGTLLIAGATGVDRALLGAAVGVKYSGDLDADADADELSNEDEFFIYRGLDANNDGIADYQTAVDPAEPDQDGDGLTDSEEMLLGTAIDKADTDEDGSSDLQEVQHGTNPLDSSDSLVESQTHIGLHKLWDMNGDGVEEVGQFGLRLNNNKPQLLVTDPVDGATVAVYSWDDNWYNPELVRLSDRNDDGVDELAIFGLAKADLRPQLVIKDGTMPSQVLYTFSWPANWRNALELGSNTRSLQFLELDDSSGDGVTELAVFGRDAGTQQPKLVVRSGVDPEVQLPTASWPANWSNVRFVQAPDLNSDGVDEVAIFGRRSGNGRNQLIIKDGVDPSIQHTVFNWADNWFNPQLLRLDDLSNDGVDDLALLGVRRIDGRPQMIVKDATDRTTAIRSYGWPAASSDVAEYLHVADRDGDGMDEPAVVLRGDDGSTRLLVRRGSSRQMLEVVSWSPSWINGKVHVLADLSADQVQDFALLANNAAVNYAQLVVSNSATGQSLRTFSWPSMDATASTLLELADMNDDGVGEVGLYSVVDGAGVLEIKNGANQAQLLSRVTWPAAWY